MNLRLLPILAFFALPLTLFAQTGGITIEKDVAYLPEGRKEKADLYRPIPVPGKKHPAVVIIHGGGWTSGSKHAAREINIGTTLAAHGYIAMSIDYQLHDPTTDKLCWPQNLHDCKTAVRWLRHHADRLNLDPANIGAIGGSAGGHLASMLAVTQARDGLDPTAPYGDLPCDIKCAVDMYGPIDLTSRKEISALRGSSAEFPERYREFSVTTYLDKEDPPFLILHGTADKTVDVEQSRLFARALEKLGVEHQLEIIEGAPHTFHLQPKQKDLRPLVLSFFDRHLKGK
jgi:acetyl esterase/lipase